MSLEPRGGRAASPALLLVCLALTAAALAPAADASMRAFEPVRIDLGESAPMLPALVDDEGTRVSLKALAAALGGRLIEEGAGRFSLRLGERSAEFTAERPSLVEVGGRTLTLGGEILAEGADLFLPEASIPRLIKLLRDASPADRAARAADGPRWTLLGAGAGRLQLELGLPVRPERITVDEEGGAHVVSIALAGGEEFEPPWREKVIGSRLVERVRAEMRGSLLRVAIDGGPELGAVSASIRDEPAGAVLTLTPAGPASATRSATPASAATAATLAASVRRPVRRVVLDPGHGGAEDGAIAPNGLKEKELVLDVARRLAVLLRLEGFEVVLTRDGDEDISLDERAGIANEYRADLFVSLHANASRHGGAFGAETFFLAPEATDDEARTIAALENNAARLDDDTGLPAELGGELPLILWDMAQVAYLEESSRLAETIQTRLNRLLDIRDRGVRQAPFRVLVGATCPAVLIELGFLTNKAEAARLAGSEYRQQLAEALRDAIRTFRGELPDDAVVLGGGS